MEYEEIQANEVEALKAIYASDFKELKNSSVWNQKPSPKFVIQLRPSSEFENSPIKLRIQVTMTQTYPKTFPQIEIVHSNALSGRQTETIKRCIDKTVRELKGSEMIYEVTSNIQSQIDDWARSVSEAAPNLEEDRLRRLRLEERKQKEQQEELQREWEAAAIQEEKKYDSLVLEELRKSESSDLNLSSPNSDVEKLLVVPESTPGVTTFERPVELPQAFSDKNSPLIFRQVMSGLRIRQAFFGTSYLSKAILPETHNSSDDLTDGDGHNHSDIALLLTKVGLSSQYWRTASGTRLLHDLNNELSLIRQFRHPGILPLCDFMIERFQGGAREWEMTFLTPLSCLTPLSEILDSADSVNLKTAQRWSFQILEALESLHKAGLRHRSISPQNAVVNVDPGTGETSMKLRHPQYLYTLYYLNEIHPFEKEEKRSGWSQHVKQSIQWIPPEGRGQSKPPSPSSKWDIWQFGALLVAMVVGKKELSNFNGDIEGYVQSRPRHWPSDLTDLLLSVLSADPSKRPSALELLTDQFFRSDFETYVDELDIGNNAFDTGFNNNRTTITSSPISSSLSSLATPTLRGQSESVPMSGNHIGHDINNIDPSISRRRMSNSEDNNSFSRYKQDFDEGIVLGRGGFGQVVKARNKLDGRVYAIKKIRATPSTLSHILQEVVLLSRLNHQYVVRYYTVWLEDEIESNNTDIFKHEERTSNEPQSPIQHDSLSGPSHPSEAPSQSDLIDMIPSASLSRFSAHHSLSELDLPSVSHDFMSDSGVVEFGFSESDDDAVVDDSGNNDSISDEKSSIVKTDGSHNTILNNIRRKNVANRSLMHNNRTDEMLLSRISRINHKTLYIQMEYCENHTLGDLIRQNLCKNHLEYWRLLRQILEALAYIHGEGVIHRDLKPKNIFIDQARNIKIGDFGLARSIVQPLQSSQLNVDSKNPTSSETVTQLLNNSNVYDEDLTTDVGTSLYSAIEITGSNYPKQGYNEKVDMFSLGIIFFEMVWGFGTEMERIQSIRKARSPQIELPQELLNAKDCYLQVELIKSMLNHDPSQRPSAIGMLESGKIPVEEQNMTVQEALRNIRDPRVVHQLANALFSRPLVSAQQVLYDRSNINTMGGRRQELAETDTTKFLTLSYVVDALISVFRAHGAVNNTIFRSSIFPRSTIYKGPTVVELLDPHGTLLQLPHDLTLPYARRIAEIVPEYTKSFAVDNVYRNKLQNPGLQPAKHIEVDFDIISVDTSEDSLMYDEAETISVMYDSARTAIFGLDTNNNHGNNNFTAGPDSNQGFTSNEATAAADNHTENHGLAVLIGHHDILSAILSHCGLSPPQYFAALSLVSAGSLERHGKTIMRSNISNASLDMLSKFSFRECLSRAEGRIGRLMPLSERVRSAMAHIKSVANTFKRICASYNDPEIYFSPLIHTATSEFYMNGVIFQLIETKGPSRNQRQISGGSVLAVGGRYDSLVKSFRNSSLDSRTQLVKAVGFGLSADKLGAIVAKRHVQQQQLQSQMRNIIPPRCRVFVSSLSENSLMTQGIDAVKLLWRYGLNADIIRNIVSTDDLIAQAIKENVSLVVIVKQMHALSSTNNKFKPLRIKRIAASGSQSNGDIDLAFHELVPFIQNELGLAGVVSEVEPSNFVSFQTDPASHPEYEASNDRVIILNESGKLKGGRKNKWQLEEKSIQARAQFLSDLAHVPIISVDLRDDIIEAITTVSPHASEDWKRRVVGLAPNQKAYIMTVQAKVSNEAMRCPRMILFSSKTENVFIYNY